jgi:hypothetical protein
MKNIKIAIVFFVCFALLFTAVACSSADKEVEIITSSPSESPDQTTSSPSVEISQAAETQSPQEEFAEQILYEDDSIKIVFTGMEESMFGKDINVYIENNSEENITVQVRDCSVNGFMMDPIFSSDVAAGKKANDSMTLMSSNLESNNITDISTVELSFHVFDTETLDTIFETDPVIINFGGTGGDESPSPSATGELLYEGNGITIMYQSVSEGLFGPEINVSISNDSEENVTIQVRDCSVNGFMMDPIFSSDIVAGKKANDTITFMSDDFEENGITSIETIELSFKIFVTDTFDNIVSTDPITINL